MQCICAASSAQFISGGRWEDSEACPSAATKWPLCGVWLVYNGGSGGGGSSGNSLLSRQSRCWRWVLFKNSHLSAVATGCVPFRPATEKCLRQTERSWLQLAKLVDKTEARDRPVQPLPRERRHRTQQILRAPD